MKIGIIGTRGIPNHYGGFEQFASFASPELVKRGHEVSVYHSSLHPYQANEWKGVKLIRQFDPEDRIGMAGQFIYDLNCILDSRKRNFDIILQLGYTSSSIWSFLFPQKSKLITNMDGMEWGRSKYHPIARGFLKQAEKWAARQSDFLIADSVCIQQYVKLKYGREAAYIAYGAEEVTPDCSDHLKNRGLQVYQYHLVIARMEPENNIETIIMGHKISDEKNPLLIIGNNHNTYGCRLQKKYESDLIRFINPLYDSEQLNCLRRYARYYFHGHSAGGTNPSLLEAMAAQALIIAHDNAFNRAVLGENAFYFSDVDSVAQRFKQAVKRTDCLQMIENNSLKIRNEYSWNHIINELESYFVYAMEQPGRE